MKTASDYCFGSSTDDVYTYLLRKTRLTTPEACAYLREHHGINLAASTLAKMRCQGGGPPFQKFGRAVLYLRAEIDKWVSDGLIKPVVPVSIHETGTGGLSDGTASIAPDQPCAAFAETL